jgi:DNA-binding ferritin-like protein (Dps family)
MRATFKKMQNDDILSAFCIQKNPSKDFSRIMNSLRISVPKEYMRDMNVLETILYASGINESTVIKILKAISDIDEPNDSLYYTKVMQSIHSQIDSDENIVLLNSRRTSSDMGHLQLRNISLSGPVVLPYTLSVVNESTAPVSIPPIPHSPTPSYISNNKVLPLWKQILYNCCCK